MDRIKGIEYFKRIVELGSFTAVAEEFDCSNAVISKYVKYLEEWTACKLVNRNTRTISFTEEGRTFYEYCCSVLSDTSDVLDQLRQNDSPLGQLVIASPVSLSVKLLAPLIIAFQKTHPGLQVRLNMSDEITDLVSAGVDVAIRGVEKPGDSSLVAVRVGTLERCVIASPGYLESHGTPVNVRDISDHQCLIYRLSSDSSEWEFHNSATLQASVAPVTVPVSGPLIADSSMMLIEAAKADMGLAMVPKAYVTEDLASGKLKEVILDAQPNERSIFAVYSDRRHLPRRARLFIDFLKANL